MSRAAGVPLLLVLAACSKPADPQPHSLSGTRVLPGVAPQGDPTPPAYHPSLDSLDYDGAPLTYTVTQTLEASAPPKPDPDLAIVRAARVSASGCFSDLQGGPDVRSAVVQVTVVPTGAVSRTEVSGDADAADCLRRVGDGLRFSDVSAAPGGGGVRSFSIDVSVRRNH